MLLQALLGLLALQADAQPAAAQFFDWGGGNPFYDDRPPPRPRRAVPQPQQQQGFGFNFPFFGGEERRQSAPSFWEREPQQRRRPAREPRRAPPPETTREAARAVPPPDASKAPSPRRTEGEPAQTVLVLGDSMADWLAYGLEDTFAEGGEFGVVRKVRPGSGLNRSEPRDYDWVSGAREAAGEKANFIVVMMGLGDRKPIREQKATRPPASPNAGAATGAAPNAAAGSGNGSAPASSKEGENAEGEPPAAAAPSAAPSTAVEAERPGQATSYEFRSEKWAELYGKRIEETVAALKAKRVPVIWVGLPPIRGPRTRPELSFLNDLYRERVQKAGAVYVDVWEGFVDENGDYAAYGPDVIGQVRRLRAADGVHFTKAGARKLAHYVDREIQRLLSRETPVALPVPDEPQKNAAAPSGPAARPASGPVVPLAGGAAPKAEPLVGGPSREAGLAAPDQAAGKVLLDGQALEAQRGRADDFAWSEARVAGDAQATDPPPAESVAAATRPTRTRAQMGPATATAGQKAGPAATARPGSAPVGAPAPAGRNPAR